MQQKPPQISRREALTAGAGLLGALALPGFAGETGESRQWVRSPANPMLSLGPEGAFDGFNIFAPCAVKVGGRYYLYYSGGPNPEYTKHQIGLALSDDGAHFDKVAEPLFPLTERTNFHATPALLRRPSTRLLKEGGLWHMVFCGNRGNDLEHATSRDGLTWTLDERNPIYQGTYAPSLVKVGDEYRLYHVYGGRRPWEIHLSTGKDLYSFKPHPANPMLVADQAWESIDVPGNNALVYPYVLKEGDTWIMFYASYWNSPIERPSTAIGMATSRDGLHWTKYPDNPVLKPDPKSAFDSRYVSSESIIRDGDGYKMYYGARIGTVHRYYAIGMAERQGKLLA